MNVELLSHDASDLKCVNAARVSYRGHSDELTEKDRGLINAMLREHHGSVFEHSTFSFRVSAPIIVIRQWQRHRAGHSYNEVSGRYTEVPEEYYSPTIRKQVGKAMNYSYEPMDEESSASARGIIEDAYDTAHSSYRKLLTLGVAKEVARYVLPGGLESMMYWTCNARSLMHFLALRTSDQAAEEIRWCADQAEKYFAGIMPYTHMAFVNNGRIAP